MGAEASDNRMRLSRAREQLRRRTHEWLTALPLLRRDDSPKTVPLSLTAAACIASVVAATIPSGLGPGRATTVGAKGAPVPIIGVPTTAAPVTTVATITRHSTVREAAPTHGRDDLSARRQPVSVDPPVSGDLIEGTRNGVSNHRRPPEDDSLVCIKKLRRVDDTCVPHPLLTDLKDVDPPRLVP